MGNRFTFVAVALAVGALAATLALTRGGAGDAADEVAALRADLARETAARASLERSVADLEARLAALAASPPDARAPGPAPGAQAGAPPTANVPPIVAPPTPGRRGFDEQSLLDAGFRPVDAAHLREVYETVDMERLYLRDRATREGWLDTPRYAEEARALDGRLDRMRGDLGDDGYDWFLFASGQFNRVLIADVLERSPAAGAGIEPGDRILRYGDQHVYSASELAAATTQGRAGETVNVEIERGGELKRITLPRGPIGVRLGAERARPQGRP